MALLNWVCAGNPQLNELQFYLGTKERKNFVPDKKLIEELVDEGAENAEVWCHAMEEYLDCPLGKYFLGIFEIAFVTLLFS